MPVLLFGCEIWVMTSTMTEEAESFQGEQEDPEVAQALLEHCCCYHNGVYIGAVQDPEEEAEFLAKCFGLGLKECEWQGGVGSES